MSTTPTQPAALVKGGMPSTLDLVRETVETFDADPSKSTVRLADKQTLIDLGLVLVDRERHALDGLQMLEQEMGEGAVSRAAFYRYASEFRDRFDAIRRRYRERLAKLSIAQAAEAEGRTDDMARLLQRQLMSLLAEAAVSTDDLRQLQGKDLGSMVAMLDGWGRMQVKREELALKQAENDRRQEKAALMLDRMETELNILRQKVAQLPENLKTLQSKFDELSAASERGKKIDPAIFKSIRMELIAMAEKAKPPTPEQGIDKADIQRVKEILFGKMDAVMIGEADAQENAKP